MTYKIYPDTRETVVRVSDGACIPMDESNTDYKQYLEWVAAGGVPEIVPSK